jgi:uncharacterized protein DUF4124
MRTKHVSAVTLGALLLVACARLAAAQTYIWTDDHGVVHAAAEPSEVPAKYREKAVQNASKSRPGVKVVPEDQVPAAAAPGARASHSMDQTGGGGIEVNPNVTGEDEPAPTKATGKNAGPHGLPPAEDGFEWQCASDPEGGAPHCQQMEKKYHKRERRAQAREKARKDMGIGPTDEFDPDVAKKVDKRAQEEFDKTAPEPTQKGVVRPNVDDESGSDPVETDSDEE